MDRERFRVFILHAGAGILAAAGGSLISLLLHNFVAMTPFVFFLAATLVAGWYGDLVGGFVCAVLSLFAANFLFFSPHYLLSASDTNDIGHLAALIIFACLITFLRRSQRRTYDELERSRNQLSIILRDVADGITVQDASGKLVYANYEASRALGFLSTDALLRAPLTDILKNFDLFDEEGQPLPIQSLPGRLALLGMRYPEVTLRFMNKITGESRWSVIKARPIIDAKGNVQLAISLFQDITRSKAAEQTIFQQREQFRVTLASIGDGVIATNTQGRITFLNAVAAQLTGWTEAEAFGKPIADVFQIVNEESRQTVENPVERVLHDGSIAGLANHTLLISRSGQTIPINDSGSPIRDRDNRLIGVVLVFRDVSDQRSAELILEASESHYRNLVENATDMVYSLDLHGNLVSINRAGEALLEHPRDEIIGKSVVPFIAPEYVEKMNQMLQRKIEGQEETTYELVLVSKSGRRIPLEVKSRLTADENGINGIYGIARTIPQRN